MNAKAKIAAVAILACAGVAKADFKIDLDLSGKPVKDVRKSTCGPIIGYAGCRFYGYGLPADPDTYWFQDHGLETAQAMKDAGAWFQRMWSANAWFEERNKKDKEGKPLSNPDAAFKFWKANGIKVVFTLECWGDKQKPGIYEFVQWIVDNDYKDVVAGFELGNETYYSPSYPSLAPHWAEVVEKLVKIWPGVKLGINVAELFELNPDITQVRNRMLSEGKIERNTYFAAADFNRYSAQFVTKMSELGALKHITHVIWHAYGAESPYSCSYYGIKRFRAFCEAFPELKGKQYWLTEIRPRSDEDNRCQRMFRESLVMGHYALSMIMQPEVDGYNHHQILAISGGIYQSTGKNWAIQWRDAGGEYRDMRSPYNRPRLDIGGMGAVYRILTEGIKEHPLLFHHGTSKATDVEDTFYTSSRVMDQVYARRRALKEGGVDGRRKAPKVDGEVEWVAATSDNRGELCLMMVNTKQTPETVRVTVAGKLLAAPTYRTVSCPEQFLDCREVPGDAKPWRQLSWEDTQWGYDGVAMEKYEGMKPDARAIDIVIEPNTVQTVTMCMRSAK